MGSLLVSLGFQRASVAGSRGRTVGATECQRELDPVRAKNHRHAGDRAALYSTYIGGASDDEASAMAVDASGSVFVTGTTYSTDFPATAGAYAPVAWGGV
jgi:hypothetical protein